MRRLTFLLPILAMGLLHAEPARVTAYRASTPPVIDGRGDDACWSAAIELGPFVQLTGDRAAEVQTRARLCWDDTALYLLVDADEPALVAAVQESAKVRAEATERDGNVFRDECLEIFWQPTPATVYQLAVNTIGTRWDARAGDRGWDGDWSVAVVRGEGRYTAELRLPLPTFDAPAAPGTTWRFNLARERSADGELSSWSGVREAFMKPEQFGEVVLAAGGAAMQGLAATEGWAAGSSVVARTSGGGRLAVEWPGGARTADLAPPKQVAEPVATVVLLEGETVRYRSAALRLTGGGLLATLAVPARNCDVAAWLNGAAVEPGPLELGPGLNIVALELTCREDAEAVPAVVVGETAYDVPTGWQRADGEPAEGWRNRMNDDGWATVRALDLPAAGVVRLRKAFWLPPEKRAFFPNSDTVWLPRGTSNLIRPYVVAPPGISTASAAMKLDLPSSLRYVATDSHGSQPVIGAAQAPDGERTVHRLTLEALRGAGFELSLRWANEANQTTSYEPAIIDGGTFDWRHLTATVTAPADAVSVTPLIIKWQNRDITGSFWVDNIVVREEGAAENLLDCGTFDEPAWGNTFKGSEGEGVGGSRCVKIVAKEGSEKSQQARWVRTGEEPPVAVEAGKRYVIELDLKCQDVRSAIQPRKVAALFAVPADAPLGEVEATAWLEMFDGALVELARPAQLVILPELKNVRPARSRIAPCYYGDMFATEEVLDAYADNLWRSGMTWIYGRTSNGVAKRLMDDGLNVFLSFPWHPYEPRGELQRKVEEDESLQALTFAGKRETHITCPTWFLAHPEEVEPMLAEFIAPHLPDGGYAGANWDLETPVVDPPTWCVCDRCLDAFAAEQGVARAGLTPDTLLTDHRAAWVDFRCRQNAQVMGLLNKLFKAADPEVEVSLYSGYESTYTKEHYGVDWGLMRPHLDLGIAGYGGSRDTVTATDQVLSPVPFMGGEMWYLSPYSDERPAPNPLTWRNRLLRQYLESGCVGVLIWYLPTMDGGAFYYTSEATEIIAGEEAFLLGAERVDDDFTFGGIESRNTLAFRKGNEVRVYLLHFGSTRPTATVAPRGLNIDWTLPAGATLDGGTVKVPMAADGWAILRGRVK